MAQSGTVSFNDIGNNLEVTGLSALTVADAGKVAKVSANKTFALCAAEDRFCGVVQAADGVIAGVELHGFQTSVYTGSAPVVGYGELVGNGSGGVKTPTMAGTGRLLLIVNVDTGATTVTYFLG